MQAGRTGGVHQEGNMTVIDDDEALAEAATSSKEVCDALWESWD